MYKTAEESDETEMDTQSPFAMALSGCTVDEYRGLCGAAFVPVVQTTDVRNRDDRAVGRCCDGPRHRRILVKRHVGSRFQVILDVRMEGASQSARIGDDDVIETFAANGPDHALRVGVLPR